jgi:acyl-CoA synthetase (NDP forming)
MGKLANYSDWRSQSEGMIPEFNDIDPGTARTICRSAISKQESGWLSAEDARKVLAALALPLPGGGFCRTADEAARVASELGFPVAVKLASRQIVHKTEVGGVSLNLQDERPSAKLSWRSGIDSLKPAIWMRWMECWFNR